MKNDVCAVQPKVSVSLFAGIGLCAQFLLCAPNVSAQQTGYSDPSGMVRVTVAGATAGGATQITMLANTLRNSKAFEGTATSVGAFTAPSSQILNTGVTSWSAGQWTNAPHICYIENNTGAEEAYLITAVNTSSGALTLSTIFDITNRYPATPKFTIVKAHTFASLFGSSSAEVPFTQSPNPNAADNVYLWNGNSWTTYWHNGTNWSRMQPFGNANNDVVFPDEGLLVLRRGQGDIEVVFTGVVPIKPQISTLPGGRLTMVNNRYPAGTTVSQLGFLNLPNWKSDVNPNAADKFYIWKNGAWVTYFHDGTNWKKLTPYTTVDNEVLPANTSVFVHRVSSSTEANSANIHQMPYTLTE